MAARDDEKVTIPALLEMKARGEPISMITAYDCPTARLADRAGIDVVLVGDSVANTVLGYESTVPVTLGEVLHHTRAVRRGLRRALLVGDLPFLSYQVSVEQAIESAGRLLKEGGAEAVKLEGGEEVCDRVEALDKMGIPVMGHIGLLPQRVSRLGGYRVQGREEAEARRLLNDAKALEEAGAFALVLASRAPSGRTATTSSGGASPPWRSTASPCRRRCWRDLSCRNPEGRTDDGWWIERIRWLK